MPDAAISNYVGHPIIQGNGAKRSGQFNAIEDGRLHDSELAFAMIIGNGQGRRNGQ